MLGLHFGRVALALTMVFAASSAGASPAPSGLVIAVVQSADAKGDSGSRLLSVEAPVYSGDRIVTGAVGEAQVKFRDNTKLVVGPNSSMVIDAFIFDESGSAKKIAINVTRGAFRFITGNGPKSAYSITTPTATIGVRGTEFDFNVAGGETKVVVLGGATRVCNRLTAIDR